MSGTAFQRAAREDLAEEIQMSRLAAERRFSPPPGFCPYGCGAADPERNPSRGWRELFDDETPQPGWDIFWQGRWWTPCECNLYDTWRYGQRELHIRAYPTGCDPDQNSDGCKPRC